MSRTLRTGLLATGLLAILPLIPWAATLASGRLPDGLRVASEPLDPSEGVRAQLERRARRWQRQEVTVDAGDAIRRPTREALGASVDVDAMVRRVEGWGRSGNPLTDLPALFAAWSGAVDLPWTIRVERAEVRAFVEDVAHQVDHPPQPPRISERGRLLELSRDGARLDRGASGGALLAALARGDRSARLTVERISSGVGDSALPPLPPIRTEPVLVARYTTDYATRGGERSRAHNVELAASFLDGATIPALGRLSFNERVGERSSRRGYRVAHVILDGEMVDGLGGGVCQVASTLHAAAFLGGLEIVEHRPHSRPSAYVPMGLDATVVWPEVDLVVRNPFELPLQVRARAARGQMVVELYGARRPATVDWHRTTLDTEGWSDRYVEDVAVPPGEARITQRPVRGYTILRERTIHDEAGVRIEHRRIRYPPTDRILRVAPGTVDPATGAPIVSEGAVPDNPF